MTTLQEFYEYTVSQAEMAPSPAVFSHGDAWQANIYKLNDCSFRLNDYDNANIGPRIWDLQYFWISKLLLIIKILAFFKNWKILRKRKIQFLKNILRLM